MLGFYLGVSDWNVNYSASREGYELDEELEAINLFLDEEGIEINCSDEGAPEGADGWVEGFTPNTVRLTNLSCEKVGELSGLHKNVLWGDDFEYARLLVHEGLHTQGSWDEAYTECLAYQKTPEFLTLLGWTNLEYNQEMAAKYFQRDYLSAENMTSEYYSPECVDGGSWDLDELWKFSN